MSDLWRVAKARVWTDDETAEIRRLHESGETPKAIGERFNVSDSAIRHLLGRLQEREARTTTSRLRALHDNFDAANPGRRASRPKWANERMSKTQSTLTAIFLLR